MIENPQPDPVKSPTEIDVIRIGFLQVPRDQLFPVLLAFVLLVSGLGVVIATRETIQLLGLMAIIVGLGWGAFIYLNAQNRLKYGAQESARKFNIILLVLSSDGQPVRGASVTVIGPVPFTDRKTDKDGRVTYTYTGRDANNYRNRDVVFNAKHEGSLASVSEKLLLQDGQHIELRLKPAARPLITTPSVPQQSSTTAHTGASNLALNPVLFHRLVNFLTPHVANEAGRSALINRAFFGEPVVAAINTSGSSADFAAHLITQLHANGREERIITLLQTLRSGLGSSRQQEIDALITELQAQ